MREKEREKEKCVRARVTKHTNIHILGTSTYIVSLLLGRYYYCWKKVGRRVESEKNKEL